MKAAIVEKFGTLTVRDIPEPRAGDYGAFCELLYGATCSGTDAHLIDGHQPFASWVRCPFVLGHESIGRVLRVGRRVRNLRVGDLVTRVGTPAVPGYHVGWGGFAEFGVALDWRAMEADGVPATEWHGSRWNRVLPAGTDPAAATMVITWRETLSYLLRMGFGADRTLVVLGSGGNGLSFLVQARNLGAATTVMIGSPGRRAQAERAGAAAMVDYRAPDVGAQALAVCPGGFDFAIDALGRSAQANLGLSLLRPGGTIGVYGLDEAEVQLDAGRARGAFTANKNGYDEAETHEQVMAMLQAGKLDASLWLDLDRAYPLSEIGAAFAAVRRREIVKGLVKLG